MKYSFIVLMTALLFSGCFENAGDMEVVSKSEALDREAVRRDSVKLSAAEIEARSKRDLAEITMKKELASEKLRKELELQKIQDATGKELASEKLQKELELKKIQSATDKEKLSIDKALEFERIKQRTVILEQENRLELQRYMVFLAALVLLIIAAAVYFFVKNRRDDKLRAYNDNLEKYFRSKENEMQYKIANKVLDTISEGGLSKEQETQLLNTLHGKFEHRDEDPVQIEDARIIDASSENEKE